MPFKTDIGTYIQKYGVPVEYVPGWEKRGNVSFNPKAVVAHHTAGAPTGIRPSLNVCTYGRAGLSGPLCNIFLDRNGVAVVVAAGRANHAGVGGFRGLTGNSAVFGIEAESTGVGTLPWTDAQLKSYPKVIAGLLDSIGQDHTWVTNHKVWAPTRKVDCAGLTNDWFQNETRKAMQFIRQEDDMFSDEDRKVLNQNGQVAWNILRAFGGSYDNKTSTINWEGHTSLVDGKTNLSLVDFIRWIDKNTSDLTKQVAELKAEIATLKNQ